MQPLRIPRRTLLGIAVLGALGLGCGKNRVLLDVDVRSFMDEASLTNPYDAPPGLPITSRLDSIPVNLVEGFQDFGTAESATMDIAVTYDNATGAGRGQFILRFGDDPTTLWTTTPVGTVDVDLQPGTVTTGQVQIQADPRVLDLFTSKRFWMGVDMDWQPQGLEPLHGVCTISQIQVHLVSTLDLF